MSMILMTTLFYKALILQGEIWSWSLLGLKGLSYLPAWKSTCRAVAKALDVQARMFDG